MDATLAPRMKQYNILTAIGCSKAAIFAVIAPSTLILHCQYLPAIKAVAWLGTLLNQWR
jgi:hypothetical protein